jgi:hypothetical protein
MPAMVVATSAKTESPSWSRCRGASFSENALRSCCAVLGRRWIFGDRYVNDSSTVVREDDEDEEQAGT